MSHGHSISYHILKKPTIYALQQDEQLQKLHDIKKFHEEELKHHQDAIDRHDKKIQEFEKKITDN